MTTFAPTATKANPPLQLFTMFSPGGASNLKSFTLGTGGGSSSPPSSSSPDPHRSVHHRLHHIHQFGHIPHQRGDEDGTKLEPLHPVRPARHFQHAAQWAETNTTVAPGLIVRSTTATVSQWSEYSTTSVQQTTEVSARTTGSSQFQTIRTQTIASSSSSNPSVGPLTPGQYLDDLKLPTQQLDLAAQLGKGSIARKGSLGGRRPPTIRCRRISQGVLAYPDDLQQQQQQQQHEDHRLIEPLATIQTGAANSLPTFSVANSAAPSVNGTESIRSSGRSRTPPPRPPPPVFRQQPQEQQQQQAQPQQPVQNTNWSCSRSGTPPSLPANSPPPLPDREELDFVMDDVASSSASVSPAPSRMSAMTDVVEINDKESVEDGEVVRRRTIITLGPRVMAQSGSSSSINITLLNSNGSGPISTSSLTDLTAKHPAAGRSVLDQQASADSPRINRASAFNARRTIEQRRQQAQQPAQQQQQQPEKSIDPAPAVVKTPPSSTYLYGENGSPASSFGGSSLRTMSISMSFDDLESNASISEAQRRPGGRNRTEAWYERRQSYGFEAADKLQSLLNTSGSSDVPSTGAVSRSCDSLSSTVRSTSSAIEKMIPPWIRNSSPASSKQPEEEREKQPPGSRLSYFGQSMEDVSSETASRKEYEDDEESVVADSPSPAPTTPVPRTPTPSVQRSESSRSATNVLEEAEPIWLRDLKVRRSLRDGRRKVPVVKSPLPMESPVWMGVKLRPTGLSLVDPDPSDAVTGSGQQPSPTKPHHYTPIFTFTNTGTSSKIQQLLRNSREELLSSSSAGQAEPIRVVTEEQGPPLAASSPKAKAPLSLSPQTSSITVSKEDLPPPPSLPSPPSHGRSDPVVGNVIRVQTHNKPHKATSSIIIVNSSRESLHSIAADASVTSSGETAPPVNRSDRHFDAMSAMTETASVYSAGDWTECSSAVTSVKNSVEDLTQSQSEVRKAKKVAFGADVKEESDQKRSRPRRIRSRSPETRLRQWQEKLEEVKSTYGITQAEPSTTPEATTSPSGLPFKRFGDDMDQPESTPSTTTTTSSTTSESFRSLLLARKSYVISAPAVKESVVIDSYPTMKVSSIPAEVAKPSPTAIIRNGIVNFDSSVERKIVILETETVPAPKSILKKRSVENLLESELPKSVTTTAVPAAAAAAPVAPLTTIHSGITVSMTNQKKEPPPEQQEVLPWRIHLKHVEPATIRLVKPPEVPANNNNNNKEVVAVHQPQEVPPWRAEVNRKKTPPFIAVAGESPSTPGNLFRGRSPSVVSDTSSPSIPGISAAELIRNLRPSPPVMMVARCEVRESVYRPIQQEIDTTITTTLPDPPEPSLRTDHGYHSLEADAAESGVFRRSSRLVVDASKTIDETIARLNETIEEIRSVDVRAETPVNGFHSPTESPPLIKRELTPPRSFSPIKIKTTPIPSKIASPAKMPESRFVIGEIRPSPSSRMNGRANVQETRTFFQATSKAIHKVTPTNHQTGGGRQVDVIPETISSSSAATTITTAVNNHQQQQQQQRPRKTTTMPSTTEMPAGSTIPAAGLTDGRLTTSQSFRSTTSTSSSSYDVDVTSKSTKKTTVKSEDRQSFVTASGDGRDGSGDTTAAVGSVTGVHLPIAVHRKAAASPDLLEANFEELVSKFEKSNDTSSPSVGVNVRKRNSVESFKTSSSINSRTRTSNATTLTTTMQSSSKSSQFSSSIKNSMPSSKPTQPAKRSNSVELTSGMPEDKAALLVRKFFGNSVIESKMSRITKTETIMEESSEVGSASICEDKAEEEDEEDDAAVVDTSLDSDELFRPSSGAEVMSTSSFGSMLDIVESTTDDDRSIRTTSSVTLTNTTRYSSCSERSVKLSDIINRPEKPSLMDSTPSSPRPFDDFGSCATSESASIAISLASHTTTDTSSTGSLSRSGSIGGSIRRNKTQRHPTVIRRDRGVAATAAKTTAAPKAPTRSRLSNASSMKRSSASGSPSTTASSTPGQRRRANGTTSSRPSTADSSKTASTRSTAGAAKIPAPPVRPPRTLHTVNHSTETKRRSVRSSATGGSTLLSPTVATTARISSTERRSSRTSTLRSAALPVERKTTSTSAASQAPLANRTNRLVTITSYKSRGAAVKPDDITAVTGIKVTPIAVGSGHYKIRMDQRIGTTMDKATSSVHKPTSHRTSATSTTTSLTEKRSSSNRRVLTKL